MKSLNSVTVLALAAALFVGATGCKKTPKNTTFIPGVTRGGPTDPAGGGPIRLGNGQTGNPLPAGNPLVDPNGPGGKNLAGVNDNTTSKPFDPNDPKNSTLSRPPEGPEDREILKAETVHFDYDLPQ